MENELSVRLKKDGAVKLKGDWEFYWQQQLSPDDFLNSDPPRITGFMRVPEYWNNYETNGVKLPGEGYATYRLTVLLDGQKQQLALGLMEISTAADIARMGISPICLSEN